MKMKGGMAGFHSDINAKVASVIYNLFDQHFLKNMSWGSKNGVPKGDQVCLVDYPVVTEIIRSILSKENENGDVVAVDEKIMRASIQNIFKNHIRKNQVVKKI